MTIMMLDRILASKRWHPIFGMRYAGHRAERDRFDALLRAAVAFDIQNVADYCGRENVMGNWPSIRPGGDRSVESDPAAIVCAPPCPLMWLEYEGDPAVVLTSEDGQSVEVIEKSSSSGNRAKMGWLLRTFDREEIDHPQLRSRRAHVGESVWADTRWITFGTSWQFRRHAPKNLTTGPDFDVALHIDRHGKLLRRDFGPYFNRVAWDTRHFSKPNASDWAECFSKFVPVMFSLTFMHCRNVKTNAEPSSAKSDRVWRKRTGYPHTIKRTLVLDGSGASGSAASNGNASTVDRRLHICRGHFRHYTADKPLFGNYVGPVWVPAHTRGSEAAGEIDKTYRVKS